MPAPQWVHAFLCSAAVASAFAFEGWAYNAVYIAQVLPLVGKQDMALPFALLFNTFFALSAWSYVQARFSDPGAVPQRWQAFVLAAGDKLQVAASRSEWQPGKATYCTNCGVPRPERAHHCRICGVCVLRMDHHCPWLNNCVGFRNHKFFVLAVAYGLLACVVGIFTSLPEIAAAFDDVVHSDASFQPHPTRRRVRMHDSWVLLAFGFAALLLALVLSTMFAAHLELCAHNATSIEGHYDNMPNPFDQGTCLGNFAQVFGHPGLDWLLPVTPLRPVTDGISYERTDQRILGHDMRPKRYEGMPSEEIWRIRYHVRHTAAPKDLEATGSATQSGWFGGSYMGPPLSRQGSSSRPEDMDPLLVRVQPDGRKGRTWVISL